MSEPRPVTASGHPRGRLASWLLIAVATTAFAAGGVALIFGVWWLVIAMAGVCVACVAAGGVVGVMNDTVAWTAPLPARYRPPRGTVLGSARPWQERSLFGTPESDVASDAAQARIRATGGHPQDMPDRNSTTGTTPNATFVGRVTGQDVGYAEVTGAERRQQSARPHTRTARRRGLGGRLAAAACLAASRLRGRRPAGRRPSSR